jgi:hypothetical protein
MTNLCKSILGILLLLVSVPALAYHCPVDMKKIDAALASNPSISATDMSRVKELRASGEKMHKSGKHGDSVSDLAEAMELLGIQ